MKKGAIPFIPIILALIAVVALAGTSLHTVTPADLQQCKFAVPQYLSISCKGSGYSVQNDVNSTPDGTSFTISGVQAHVDSVQGNYADYTLYDSSALTPICGQVGTSQISCAGYTLTPGHTYSLKANTLFGLWTRSRLFYSQQNVLLKLSDSNGQYEVDIPGTWNCIRNDLQSDLIKAGNSVIGASTVDASKRSISLQPDQTVAFASGYYKEIPSLITVNYSGQPAICDRASKKIIGFDRHNALDGTCYLVQNSGTVLYDGSNDNRFACSDPDCQVFGGLSSDYIFSNFHCADKTTMTQQQIEETRPQCITDTDCAAFAQYISDYNGNVVLRTMSCSSGKCSVPKDTIIGCNPALSYPNNQCCQRNVLTGVYSLQQCTVNLKSCDSLGSGACCLDTQSQYTVKTAPNGKYCCEVPKGSGIGSVTNTIDECKVQRGDYQGGFDLGLGGLGNLFGDIGSALQAFGIWLVIVLVIIAVIVVGGKRK